MALHTLAFSLAVLLFSSPILSWPEPESKSTTSLTLPLLHIDDLYSTSDVSPSDSRRVKFITSLTANATTHGITSNVILLDSAGVYFIRLGVGTPAKDVYLSLDTGSDVVWLQCLPCVSCYTQTDPIFNPAKSKSYSTVPCGSPICRKLDPTASSCVTQGNKTCLYQVEYGDGSQTYGGFATETLTFHDASVEHFAIGCGHKNTGLFNASAGLLGLGRGPASFVSQTKNRYNGRFSYCLGHRSFYSSSVKPKSSANIMFGDGAIPKNAVFTPILTNPNPELGSFYYLQLLGISVGGSRVRGVTESQFKINSTSGDGGIIIDSATTITYLVKSAYVPFRDAFRLRTTKLKRAKPYAGFDTCYDLSGMTKVKLPTVVFHFAGGDLLIPEQNYLFPVEGPEIFCLGFMETTENLSIIGNVQQQGIRVAYDLVRSRVGFLPGGC